MGFSRKIKYFLVHQLQLSNKKAQELIDAGRIEIDALPIRENCLLSEGSEIRIDGEIVRKAKDFVYLKFHKPRGFESTLSTKVKNNLAAFFTDYSHLAIAGRLDKDSEGLLLLSNNGKWVEQLCHPKFEKEKEYLVELDKAPAEEFLATFQNGVTLGDGVTAPCSCEPLEETSIRVHLKEGRNRQIRRMCHKLGYQVLSLKRLRIDQFELSDLEPGMSQLFTINSLSKS